MSQNINNFITIVEKPIYQQIIDDCGGEEAFCIAAGIIKEPILYTEGEVEKLVTLAWATASAYGELTDQSDCDDWFKHNKKK